MQSLKPSSKLIATSLFVVYMGILIKYILFRRSQEYIQTCLGNLRHFRLQQVDFSKANFIPFKAVRYYLSGVEQKVIASENLLGNFIGFMPLGLLVPLIFTKVKNVKSMLAFSLFTSFAFELIQLLTGLGIFDVDDLLLNTAGGITGYFVFLYFNRQYSLVNS